MELDCAGDFGDAGLTWLAGGEVAGLLGLARAGPAGRSWVKKAGMRILARNVAKARSACSGGESRHSGGRGGQGVREADLVRGDARRVRGDPGEPADGLADGEQRPHLLHDALGVAGAQDGLALAHVGLVVADDCLTQGRATFSDLQLGTEPRWHVVHRRSLAADRCSYQTERLGVN